MNFTDAEYSLLSCSHVELRSFIVCFSDVETFVVDAGKHIPGIRGDVISRFLDVLRKVRDCPVSIHCQPAACSAETPITGVALPDDQYLLRISPEGRRILILGLSAALREIEDWEFSILTSCSKEYVQGLIDVLEEASPKS